MARLPAPIIDSINAIWPEEWAVKENNFYSILGQAVRKRRNKEEGGEKEDKSE